MTYTDELIKVASLRIAKRIKIQNAGSKARLDDIAGVHKRIYKSNKKSKSALDYNRENR